MNPYIALSSILGLVGVWYLVSVRWSEYRLDSFRDDLFRIRDGLFMFAADDGISFEHPAYSILRERMNVLIRYAHEITLTRLIIVAATQDYYSRKSAAIIKWEAAVAELPEPTRSGIEEYNRSLAFAIVKHLVFSSFFRYLAFRPTISIVKLLKGRDVLRNEVVNSPRVVSNVEALESDALEQDAIAQEKAIAATA